MSAKTRVRGGSPAHNIAIAKIPSVMDLECTECADGIAPVNGSCLSARIQHLIYKKPLPQLRAETECNSEICVLSKLQPSLRPEINIQLVNERNSRMLNTPPETEDALLTNFNIDKRLTLMANNEPYRMMNLGFSMIDFNDGCGYETPLTIPTILNIIRDNPQKRHFVSVCNTDMSRSDGIHWFCIMLTRHRSKLEIEYFNSSGQAPPSRIKSWEIKLKHYIQTSGIFKTSSPKVELRRIIPHMLQRPDDQTECGMYCLWFVYMRMRGAMPDDFAHANHAQHEMRLLRQKMFAHPETIAYDVVGAHQTD